MKEFARQLETDVVDIAASELTGPVVTYLVAKGRWRLEAPYSYNHGQHRIGVPSEFDLASIPSFFWRFAAPFELSIAAPLVHDFL